MFNLKEKNMHKKISKSMRAFSVAMSIIAGSSAPSYAYVMNSFDSLTNLTAGPNTSIAIDNVNYIEGTGSVKMSWDASVNPTGYFDWNLPTATNLTGDKTSFAAYTPSFITEVSIEWIDSSGQVAEGWYWNITPYLSDQWNPFTATQGDTSGAAIHIVGPGDITQVTLIRFDEVSSNGTISYNNWEPVPEPNTVLLLGTGLALFARARKKILA
jgi:hypothetical protein